MSKRYENDELLDPPCPLTRNDSFTLVSPFNAKYVNAALKDGKHLASQRSRGRTGRHALSGRFYQLIKIPTMIVVFVIIFVELFFYVSIRVIINIFEKCCSTRRYEQASAAMARSASLKEYMSHAKRLDTLMDKKRGSVPLPLLLLSQKLAKARKMLLSEMRELKDARAVAKKDAVAAGTSRSSVETPLPVRNVMKREIDTYPVWMREVFQDEKGHSKQDAGRDRNAAVDRKLFDGDDEGGDHESIESLLRTLCVANHSGIDDELFFSQSYTGRNVEAEACAENTAQTIRAFARKAGRGDRTSRSSSIQFIRDLQRSYGNSALCMSGGAACGYYHLGVVRALVHYDMLPNVFSGSSAGAVVAAAICCAGTRSELLALVDPSIYKKCTPCSENKLACLYRLCSTGSYLSQEGACKSAKGMLGEDPDITFLEAYRKTGRVLCISVYNGEHHSQVLNYITAPNVCIFSAVVASAAIPMLLPPQTLLQKLPNGGLAPWTKLGDRWIDGGLEGDLPIVQLQQSFNVKYTIVSQVEPHLTPFYFFHSGSAGRPTSHRNGQGWRAGFVLSFAEHSLKSDMKRWLQMLRDFDLVPRFFGHDLSAAFLQDKLGTVTILPQLTPWDFVRLLSDPGTPTIMKHYLDSGARQVWPKLHMIRCRFVVERSLENALRCLSNPAT